MAFINAKKVKHEAKLDVVDSWDNMETLNKMEAHCKNLLWQLLMLNIIAMDHQLTKTNGGLCMENTKTSMIT